MNISQSILGYYFLKFYVLNLTRNWLGYILGDFFSNPSGHPVCYAITWAKADLDSTLETGCWPRFQIRRPRVRPTNEGGVLHGGPVCRRPASRLQRGRPRPHPRRKLLPVEGALRRVLRAGTDFINSFRPLFTDKTLQGSYRNSQITNAFYNCRINFFQV
jgi:hypothetical protein